jgi:hypothetical protein
MGAPAPAPSAGSGFGSPLALAELDQHEVGNVYFTGRWGGAQVTLVKSRENGGG